MVEKKKQKVREKKEKVGENKKKVRSQKHALDIELIDIMIKFSVEISDGILNPFNEAEKIYKTIITDALPKLKKDYVKLPPQNKDFFILCFTLALETYCSKLYIEKTNSLRASLFEKLFKKTDNLSFKYCNKKDVKWITIEYVKYYNRVFLHKPFNKIGCVFKDCLTYAAWNALRDDSVNIERLKNIPDSQFNSVIIDFFKNTENLPPFLSRILAETYGFKKQKEKTNNTHPCLSTQKNTFALVVFSNVCRYFVTTDIPVNPQHVPALVLKEGRLFESIFEKDKINTIELKISDLLSLLIRDLDFTENKIIALSEEHLNFLETAGARYPSLVNKWELHLNGLMKKIHPHQGIILKSCCLSKDMMIHQDEIIKKLKPLEYLEDEEYISKNSAARAQSLIEYIKSNQHQINKTAKELQLLAGEEKPQYLISKAKEKKYFKKINLPFEMLDFPF